MGSPILRVLSQIPKTQWSWKSASVTQGIEFFPLILDLLTVAEKSAFGFE